MTVMANAAEVSKMKEVVNAFQSYLESSKDVDLFFSEKRHIYFLTTWNQNELELVEQSATAEQLCTQLLTEVFNDLYLELGLHQRIDQSSATEECIGMARERMAHYLDKLPQYQYLIDKVLQDK